MVLHKHGVPCTSAHARCIRYRSQKPRWAPEQRKRKSFGISSRRQMRCRRAGWHVQRVLLHRGFQGIYCASRRSTSRRATVCTSSGPGNGTGCLVRARALTVNTVRACVSLAVSPVAKCRGVRDGFAGSARRFHAQKADRARPFHVAGRCFRNGRNRSNSLRSERGCSRDLQDKEGNPPRLSNGFGDVALGHANPVSAVKG